MEIIIITANVYCQFIPFPYFTDYEVRYFLQRLTFSLHEAVSFLRTDWFSANKEIPRILWNPIVHYCTYKCLPPVPILSQISPVHSSQYLKTKIKIILPCIPGSSKLSLSVRFLHRKNCIHLSSPHTRYMAHPSHSSRFYQPNNI